MRHTQSVILQMYNFGLNFLLLNNRVKSCRIRMNKYKIVEVMLLLLLLLLLFSVCRVMYTAVVW
jgi:hypothetical protein